MLSLPLRILLVDDDPFARDVALTALSSLPRTDVAAFAGGAQALAALPAFQPDVVVLDLLMPVMDGRALWSEIRSRMGRPPAAIFLTARDDAATRAEIKALGASLIAKPFDPLSLAGAVRGLIGAPALKALRLENVKSDFTSSLPRTLSAIDRSWRIIERTWAVPAAENMVMEAHKLAGAAGLFHFHRLGAAADRLEELLRATLSSDGWRGQAEFDRLETAVHALMVAGLQVA